MREYWSNSKLADSIRGTPKPYALGMQEWKDWEAAAKAAHPIRYWVSETLLDKVEAIVKSPYDLLYTIKYKLINRFVSYTHGLSSHQLSKYDWHDLDQRLLFSIFDELVTFVEIELAAMRCVCYPDLAKSYKVPWNMTGPFKLRTYRCPQAGIDYLLESATLTFEKAFDVPSDAPNAQELTKQALDAIEILELYKWWKEVYPNRADPTDASGLSTHYDNKSLDDVFSDRPLSENVKDMHDKCNNLEQQYYDEETEMLCRLIKIRSSLWT